MTDLPRRFRLITLAVAGSTVAAYASSIGQKAINASLDAYHSRGQITNIQYRMMYTGYRRENIIEVIICCTAFATISLGIGHCLARGFQIVRPYISNLLQHYRDMAASRQHRTLSNCFEFVNKGLRHITCQNGRRFGYAFGICYLIYTDWADTARTLKFISDSARRRRLD